MLTGAAWGFIPGFLKARTGAHEVITTIMLNYVAAQIVLFGLRSRLPAPGRHDQPISKVPVDFVDIPQILDLPAIRLHYGFIVALLMAAVVSLFLFKTTKGFELRAAGFNLTAARYAGMSAGGSIMLAMSLSGGLAGLGGSFEVLGTVGQMSNDLSSGYRLQRDRPRAAGGQPARAAIVLAALLFGALTDRRRPDADPDRASRSTCSCFIMALVIMFVAAPEPHPLDLARQA